MPDTNIKESLEGFGKDLYTRVASARQAKAAAKAVEYLDEHGVFKALKPTSDKKK